MLLRDGMSDYQSRIRPSVARGPLASLEIIPRPVHRREWAHIVFTLRMTIR